MFMDVNRAKIMEDTKLKKNIMKIGIRIIGVIICGLILVSCAKDRIGDGPAVTIDLRSENPSFDEIGDYKYIYNGLSNAIFKLQSGARPNLEGTGAAASFKFIDDFDNIELKDIGSVYIDEYEMVYHDQHYRFKDAISDNFYEEELPKLKIIGADLINRDHVTFRVKKDDLKEVTSTLEVIPPFRVEMIGDTEVSADISSYGMNSSSIIRYNASNCKNGVLAIVNLKGKNAFEQDQSFNVKKILFFPEDDGEIRLGDVLSDGIPVGTTFTITLKRVNLDLLVSEGYEYYFYMGGSYTFYGTTIE